jgi:hypothetical protein
LSYATGRKSRSRRGSNIRSDRDKALRKLRERGESIETLADVSGLSVRQVERICEGLGPGNPPGRKPRTMSTNRLEHLADTRGDRRRNGRCYAARDTDGDGAENDDESGDQTGA